MELDELTSEGTVLAGKYRVERMLGKGGMGVVVAATHLQLRQLVALKFLLPEACANPEALRRFLREGRAAAKLHGEHVVRVSDVGTLESGTPYIVMEYLSGADLAEVLVARGPLPVAEAADYVLQACEALAEAHAAGLVHRDIKPSNLFLTRRADGSPLIKVLDFGISKAATPLLGQGSMATATRDIVGSPQYMSPEQIRSARDVDARTDVWSLGAVLYELVTDALVYEAETVSAQLAMIAADPPPALRAKRPEAPQELEAAILRCLEKDRERRFANVAEFGWALAPFSGSGRASAERVGRILGVEGSPDSWSSLAPSEISERPVPVASRQLPTVAAWDATARSSGRRTGLLVAGGVLMAAVTVGLMSLWRSTEPVAAVPSAPHLGAQPGAEDSRFAASSTPAAAPVPAKAPLSEPPSAASADPSAAGSASAQAARSAAPGSSLSAPRAASPSRRRKAGAKTREGERADWHDVFSDPR